MTLTNIRAECRFYLNDPTTAANNLWSNTDLDMSINRAYRQTANLLRRHRPGWFQDVVYTATTTSEDYDLPSGVKFILHMRVSNNGTDLQANPGSTSAEDVTKAPSQILTNVRDSNGPRVWVPNDAGFLLVPALTTGNTGSNAIEIFAEKDITALSTGTDVPDFPADHHDIIVARAVMLLKMAKNLNASQEANEVVRLEQDLLIALHTMGEDDQFRTAVGDAANYYNTSRFKQGVHG